MATSIKKFKCADGLMVKGDGKHDDTTGIIQAFSQARDVYFPLGTYLITSTIPVKATFRAIAENSSLIKFLPKDNSIVAFDFFKIKGDPYSRKEFIGFTIEGPSGRTNPKDFGKYIGLKLTNCYGGLFQNINIYGFDFSAIDLYHSYYVNFHNIHTHHNGYGVKCDGGNATSFINLSTQYNTYGAENIHSMIGGCVQANFKSGIRFNELAIRAALHDVYFEHNNLSDTETHAADIWCNAVPNYLVPSAGETWKSAILSLSGSTTFHTAYSTPGVDEKIKPTHSIAGCFQLTLNIAGRFFNGNKHKAFHLHPWSLICDNSVGNPVDSIKSNLTGPINYIRASSIKLNPQ